MRILKICFIPLVLILINSCNPPSNESKPYNVLFLIVDDMNDYGFYNNYKPAKTPYLDAFKESALTFRQAYCASPVCTPSRAATFSGLYPHVTGAYFNGSDPWRTSDTLKKIQTLPECFRANGYKIYGRGKLYHAKLEEYREKSHWDNTYYGGGFAPFVDSAHMLKGRFWGVQAFPDSVFPDVINCDHAIDYLNKEHDKPFFMALGLWRPHTPFTAPQRFFDMFDIKDITIPDGYKENDLDDISPKAKQLVDPFKRFVVSGADNPDEWKKFILGYNATTAFADWNIGRVIEALDNSKYKDNTIIVFWSDNGYLCGEKEHWEKGVIWEQACLTPMAIRVPGAASNGKMCKRIVNLVDLYPTLVDLCGLDNPGHLMGESLRPLIENPEHKWENTSLTTLGIEYASVKNEQFRYIRFIDGSEELYNHHSDPYEFENIANNPEYSDVKKELAKSIPTKWAPELKGRRH